MNTRNLYKFLVITKSLVVALWIFVIPSLPVNATVSDNTPEVTNTRLVQQAFAAWQNGEGSVFDLLADNSVWTVAGSSPVSGVYNTRQEFLERAVQPIHARLDTAIRPEVKQIIAQGNQVMVLWDGSALAQDGSQYSNSYAWHMVFDGGQIKEVTAFLDTWELNQLMQ